MLKTIQNLKNGEKMLIVCIGDSITEQNYHLHGHLNYVGQLSEKLIATFGRKSFVFNTGLSGETTWGAIMRLEKDALRFRPDLVTVMYGINDSKMGLEGIPEFKSNLSSIIQNTREAGSEIMLLTPNVIALDTIAGMSEYAHLVNYPEYIQAIREVASSLQVPLCDMNEKWTDLVKGDPASHNEMMDDELHPNEKGHSFMAQTLFQFLELH